MFITNRSDLNDMVNVALATRPDAIIVVLRAGYMLALRKGEMVYSDDFVAWQK
jgi:hypothetical protein